MLIGLAPYDDAAGRPCTAPAGHLGSTATYACLLANTFGEAAAPSPGARQAVGGEVAGGARSAAAANTGRMLEVVAYRDACSAHGIELDVAAAARRRSADSRSQASVTTA
jgi:hypothetical protein